MLSAKIERKVIAEASRRGVQADQLVEQLIDIALPQPTEGVPNQSSIDLLNEWEARTATDNPQEIARRLTEFEKFKREMNLTRLLTDGPDARIPFP